MNKKNGGKQRWSYRGCACGCENTFSLTGSALSRRQFVAGIAGAAFGPGGKNFLRFSLVSARKLLEEALERVQRVSMHWRAAVSR